MAQRRVLGASIKATASPSARIQQTAQQLVGASVPSRRVCRRHQQQQPLHLLQFHAAQQKRWSSVPADPSSSSAQPPRRRKRTVIDLQNLKRQGVPITMLTAHDFSSARFIEAASQALAAPETPASGSGSSSTQAGTTKAGKPLPGGVDICLIGDSLAMVALGHDTTVALTLEEMMHHCRAVARGCPSAFRVADLPFGSYLADTSAAAAAAFRLVQEGRVDAVKIEGGVENIPLIQRLIKHGVPVMAHIGLMPQRTAALGGYRIQGRGAGAAKELLREALELEASGAFAVLIEAVPAKVAEYISQRLTIPTIGIGAGSGCDGQVLVQLDMLGARSLARQPRFLKTYMDLEALATDAIREYIKDVRGRQFPAQEHEYEIGEAEWQEFVSQAHADDASSEGKSSS